MSLCPSVRGVLIADWVTIRVVVVLTTTDELGLELLCGFLGVDVGSHVDLGLVALLLDHLLYVHRQVRLNVLKDGLSATLLEGWLDFLSVR